MSTEIEMPPVPPLVFTPAELLDAHERWGCNCGPAALAACCKKSLRDARNACRMFGPEHLWMSPFDMQSALIALRMRIHLELIDGGNDVDFYPSHGLCLIQLGGPWITEKFNPGWAAKHTHWIASKWTESVRWIFDVNQLGWRTMDEWLAEIVPSLLAADKFRDGTYWLKHSWEIRIDPGNRSRKSYRY